MASKGSKAPKEILETEDQRAHVVGVPPAHRALKEFKARKENVAHLARVLVGPLVLWAPKEKGARWVNREQRGILGLLGHKVLAVATVLRATRVLLDLWAAQVFVAQKVIVVCKVPKATLACREPKVTKAMSVSEVLVGQPVFLGLPVHRELLDSGVPSVLWDVAVSKVRWALQERWVLVDRRETEETVVFAARKV